jgi:hypothetical protein
MQRNPSSRRPPVQQRPMAPARKVVQQPPKHRKLAPKQAGRRLNLPR